MPEVTNMVQRLLKFAEKKNPKVRRALHIMAVAIVFVTWAKNRAAKRSGKQQEKSC